MLSSLKILDFTTLLPGPFASMMLADLGADVIRVEAPGRPDMVRFTPPFDGDLSAWHALLNRSKRSLALDLKQEGAAEVVKRLVAGCDIVLEQFRPGVMARLGIGYDVLRSVNPGLIYCAITGYGQSGPYRDRAGHDNNYLALAGVMSHSGRRRDGPPPLGIQVADIGGGSFGAIIGILAAVIERNQSGLGQMVDVSMFDMALAWNSLAVSHYIVGGRNPEPEGTLLNGGGLYDYYATSDGRYLAVGSLEPKFWTGFCRAIGRPDLITAGLTGELAQLAPVKTAVAETIATQSLAAWTAVFADLDVCVEPVLTVAEALEHPQTAARELLVEVPRPDGTSQTQVGSPLKFSRSRPTFRHTGAPAGAHTAEILAEAGYGTAEIEALRAAGVFG